MRITELTLNRTRNKTRASAMVSWEDCDQPEKEIFIETGDNQNTGIMASPHAFLVGCLIPALYFGEKRIAIEGPICPSLIESLAGAMELMRIWSGNKMTPLDIEPEKTVIDADIVPRNRTGMVFSGGIDSIASMRINMLGYPKGHPCAIRDCFFIHGFDIGGVITRGMKYHVFDRARQSMEKVTSQAGMHLIPVYTNIRHLCDDRDLWLNKFFGAVLSAVAHAFSTRIDRFNIASSYDLENLVPCGSHPLLDPLYSSYNLSIIHKDAHLKRIDKLRTVAEWEPGFQNMRVCLANVEDRLNCGRCEKCVRTMTGLVAIDALQKTCAFVENNVTPDMFEAFKINIRHRAPFYVELLPLLIKQGRMDLVETITEKLHE